MSDSIQLGINLILLVLAWHCVFKPAMRDFTRDKLFTTRENLRAVFERRGELDSPAYLAARNFINHHIRFIEDRSLMRVLHFSFALADKEGLRDYLHKQSVASLQGAPDDVVNVINYYRTRANRWVKFHLIHSSFVLTAIFYMALGCVVITDLVMWILRTSKQKLSAAWFVVVYIKRVDMTFEDAPIETIPCVVCAAN